MKALIALALLGTTALAGCSSEPTGPQTPSMQDGHYVINLIAGNHFSPADAKVPVNATVMWVAKDVTAHDVSAQDGSWSSDDSGPKLSSSGRTSFMRTFPTAGTYEYQCDLHASTGMKGTITVG